MTLSDPGVCPEKTRLLNEYEQAVATFAAEVTKLRAVMGTLSRDEYNAAHDRTEDLRMVARATHEELMRHVTAHGC